jgi:hypothetical protein
MSQETARTVVDRAVQALGRGGVLHLAFQGGEPTLVGLPFFKELFTYAEEVCRAAGISVGYSLQTNGLLLDDDWCAFLHDHGVLVGLSVDGEQAAHDRYRTDTEGGTWERVYRTAKRLAAHKVAYNAVTVVTDAVAKHPTALYRFYRRRGFDYVQLIPCLAPLGQQDGPGVPDAHAYGEGLGLHGNAPGVERFKGVPGAVAGAEHQMAAGNGFRSAGAFGCNGSKGAVFDGYICEAGLEADVRSQSQQFGPHIFQGDVEIVRAYMGFGID